MNEKIGEFVKENKGKIIKGTLIVAGVIVAVAAIKLLKDRSGDAVEMIDDALVDGISENFDVKMS